MNRRRFGHRSILNDLSTVSPPEFRWLTMDDDNNKRIHSPASSKNKASKMNIQNLVNEDVLECILRRLPAKSFASAACVSKSWNKVCNGILSRPKLASAHSLNESFREAVEEVLDKVLSEPIRPHFAIVGTGFCLKETLNFLAASLGSHVPIVVTTGSGIIGRDSLSNEFDEVNFHGCVDANDCDGDNVDLQYGTVLTIGFVPGLKVDAIPLLRRKEHAPRVAMIKEFVTDIWDYTRSVSGCTSPIGIMMFGHEKFNQKPIVEVLDYTMSKETFIVGDEGCKFLYRSRDETKNICGSADYNCDAVALIFASDRDKPYGTGEIQFHVGLSKGLVAIGPTYKAVSVRVQGNRTFLTAKLEGQQEILGGEEILKSYEELADGNVPPDLYIGVTKQRKYSIGKEKPGRMTSLAYHGVVEADEECIFVEGVGIRTGDSFKFYHPDVDVAKATCQNVSTNLRKLKLDHDYSMSRSGPVDRKQVIGGYIFACCGRGDWFFLDNFFERCDVDSSPFLENFPDMPISGTFCTGEIARASKLIGVEEEDESSVRCCLHAYSTVYLLMSYTPPSEC